MAKKSKGTLAQAQASLMKALRSFEKTVAGIVSSPAPKAKKKAKRKTKARKR